MASNVAPHYFEKMDTRPILSRLSAVAAVALSTTPALAAEILIPGATPSAAELQIMRNIQSRETFQLEQRINREIDRLTVQTPSPKLEIPVVKRPCREDVNGQKMLRACR